MAEENRLGLLTVTDTTLEPPGEFSGTRAI